MMIQTSQLCGLTKTTNDHWRRGELVELLEVDPDPNGVFLVYHHCASPHLGHTATLDWFRPITRTAARMLAEARRRLRRVTL